MPAHHAAQISIALRSASALLAIALAAHVHATPLGQCPAVGDCCEDHSTPGCDDVSCCNVVCASDPFCCERAWDGMCALQAEDVCGSLCGPVCGDSICEAGESFPECPECPPVDNCPGVGGCCETHASPGCTDESCCDTVCSIDATCCTLAWDAACVNTAALQCAPELCGPTCGNAICEPGETFPECPECPPVDNCPGVGECCEAHASPGCTDEACCEAVCAMDATCCTVGWDGTCAALANTQCVTGTCGPVCGDTVCEPGETFPECPECPRIDNCPGVGDCCEAHASPGCTDESCCDVVCTADPTCCDAAWDASCVAEAGRLCGGCAPVVTGDLDGDGAVGAPDLGILLGQWGGDGTADLDGDGAVGAADLGILLGAWSA